ncbi:MAG: carboxypeptidase M32, partial [Myxococcota bacterium]
GEADHSLRGPPRQRRAGEALAALRGEVATLRHLDAAIDLLGWDEETMLPVGAREERGEQLATIEALRHRNLVSPWLGDWLGEAVAGVEPGSSDEVELQILARRRDHALLVPEGLVRAWAEARSRSLAAWEQARVDGRYATWAPAFGTLLDRTRERAQALAQRSSDRTPGAAYDALLDEHDLGMTRATVGPVLRRLRDELLPLIDAVSSDAAPARWRTGHTWADPAQDAFCRELCASLGFDFDRGRLDRSTHPFTLMAGERDVRMTVKVDERDPFVAIFGALHEVGHGLYDQGLAVAHHQRLIGTAPGMAVHESQARLVENLVGRSRGFWQWQLPKLRERFPDALRGVSLDVFLAEINRVQRGSRRVTADEVTYNLHVVVRYELEELLIAGHLGPADLPAAWNQAMVPLAGKPPASDLEGCLQDVHWAVGSFGYFPSYTVGNLYAAQLFEAWQRDHADGLDAIAAGHPEVLTGWLADRVWRHGHRWTEDELIRRATGSGLDSGPFVRYVREKYGARPASDLRT